MGRYLAMLAALALVTAWILLLPVGGAQTKNNQKAFEASIKAKGVELYCSRKDDRIYLDVRGLYGRPRGRAGDLYPRARVTVTVRLLGKGGRRVLARARHIGKLEFDRAPPAAKSRSRVGKRVGLHHHIRFGRKQSKRVLRFSRGRRSCGKGKRSRRILAKVRLVERLKGAGTRGRSKASARTGPRQSRRVAKARKVGLRSCASRSKSGCPGGAPGGADSGGVGGGETDSSGAGSTGTGSDQTGCATQQSDLSPNPSGTSFQRGQVAGTVGTSEIDEASGIVASRRNPGVLWVHNDSGDSARLFALSMDGNLLGTYTVAGASAVDWEDLAIGPGPESGADYLYIGDIGDNSAVRSSVSMYRVREPNVSVSQAPQTVDLTGVDSIQVRYPDGPRDAETLMVDPLNGDVFVLSKRDSRSRIYRAPCGEWAAQTVTLKSQGELGWGGAVGGEISPTGREVIVKSYFSVYLFERAADTDISDALAQGGSPVPYTLEPQGEAVAFDGQGLGYFTLSEGIGQPIYYYERAGS